MEKKFNDSSSALSRFGRDKRVRTVTAAAERVERRPHTDQAEGGQYERRERTYGNRNGGYHHHNGNEGKPFKRASYNPHFSEENRPLFEERTNRYERTEQADRGNRYERGDRYERRSYGEKKSYGERGDRNFGEKRFGGKRFGGEQRAYGEHKPYGEKRNYGEHKPYEKKAYGDKPFNKKRAPKRREEGERSYPRFNPEQPLGAIRLNRFLAQSGICSRREADDLITAGLVTVNGQIVTELGTKVQPSDEVKFNDSRVQGEKKVYLVLNKPKGYVTSLDDPHAGKLVMELVKGACTERIYPVGRLDKNSLGLLLFTNDGDLTKTLTHPSYRKKKIYQVTLDKPLTRADMDRLAEGITLEDGEIYADEISYLKDNKQEVGIEIHSGRNRIVRRMFEFLGYTVTKLDRVYYAGLTKKNLKRGAWRFLTKEEVSRLKSGLYE